MDIKKWLDLLSGLEVKGNRKRSVYLILKEKYFVRDVRWESSSRVHKGV